MIMETIHELNGNSKNNHTNGNYGTVSNYKNMRPLVRWYYFCLSEY